MPFVHPPVGRVGLTELQARDLPYERKLTPKAEGLKKYAGMGENMKCELIEERAGEIFSEYTLGPRFTDFCRGPHVPSSSYIKAFKVLSIAGAYWRGDEKNAQMQRIYGTAFFNQKDLDAYLNQLEEAKKRDHRKLGVALDLFTFHDVSPGSAFWHPKGQRIWRTLETAMRELQERRGYDEIATPMVVAEKLWRQSGHWDLYRDNMFLIESEGQTFSLKPMNCPESTFIYKSRVRSYRDLPLRLAEYGRLHRNERSGTLSGLTRVRHFVQDDSHIFVRPDQLADEIAALLAEVDEVYAWFGLKPEVRFGTKPDKALGDPALWERAEALILDALRASGLPWSVKAGDGAFYAPKIDVHIEDALGRSWQTATFQVDLVMLPERFDLAYIDEHGQPQRPIAIHRAVYGSLERFIGILVEHYAGAFPLWCAPVQAVVVPIADRHLPAARELADVLRGRRLRVEVDGSDGRMQNKIRLATEQKVPYILVLGDREADARTAAPRTRAGEQLPVEGWEALADRLAGEVTRRVVG